MQSGSSQNYFPLDLEGILEVGLEEWQKNFYWPISWIDFLRLEEKITDLFDRYIQEYRDHFLADLILINYKSYIEYSNFIHELLVLNDLKKKQLKPLFRTSERYRQIFEQGIPETSLTITPRTSNNSLLRNSFQNLKLMRRVVNYQTFFNILKPKVIITDASLSDYTVQYLRKFFPGMVKAKCFNEWLHGHASISSNQRAEIKEFCQGLLKGVSEIASNYKVSFTTQQLGYVKNTTERKFLNSYQLLLQVENSLNGHSTRHLFIGPNHDTLPRILSVATRKKGGKVTAFTHGEPMVYNWKKIAWMELSLVDEFVEYSSQLARVLFETMETCPTPNQNRPDIIDGNYSVLRAIRESEKDKPVPQEIKKVMVIGNAYRESGLSCVTSFPAPVQFDLELRIIQLLKKAGYKVIYKQHPGGVLKRSNFDFRTLGVEVIKESFEQNLEKADAYLFYYTRTSTFGPALCTNKPIFVIDGGWEEIAIELRTALETRCTFIKTNFDKKNLLELREGVFKNLNKHIEKAKNTKFLDKYLLT